MYDVPELHKDALKSEKSREQEIKKQVKQHCQSKGHRLLNFIRNEDLDIFNSRCELCGAGVVISLLRDDNGILQGYKNAYGDAYSTNCEGSTSYPLNSN